MKRVWTKCAPIFARTGLAPGATSGFSGGIGGSMSQQLVQHFLNDLDRLRKLSGSLNEKTIREAFKDLQKAWARQANLQFVAELEYATGQKTKVYPDGTILHDLRVPLGFWEANDTKDDLDDEVGIRIPDKAPECAPSLRENVHD